MTQEPASFGELNAAPMHGDSSLIQQSLVDRSSRVGRRGSRSKSDTSLYTDVVQEASEYGEKLRAEFAMDIPAPIMKRKLSRAQVKHSSSTQRKRTSRFSLQNSNCYCGNNILCFGYDS